MKTLFIIKHINSLVTFPGTGRFLYGTKRSRVGRAETGRCETGRCGDEAVVARVGRCTVSALGIAEAATLAG